MSEYYDPPVNPKDRTEDDYVRMAGNVAPHVRHYNWTLEQRINAAKSFGPNWASILNGCGDQ